MLVSVIITNYNYSKYLRFCIDSVINQTYKKIELIIIDDCSSDDSIDIISSYANKYNNISFRFNSQNKGVIYSRNLGIDIANGYYICFLDADDFWGLTKIEKQVNAIKDRDISFCDLIIIDNFNNVIRNKKHKSINNIYDFSLLLKYNFLAHSSIMIKKSHLSNVFYKEIPNSKTKDVLLKMFSVNRLIHEDYDFLLRFFKFIQPQTAYLEEELVFYRKHNNNFSKGWIKKFLSVLLIFHKSLNYNFFKSLFFTFRISFFTILRNINSEE